MRYFLVFTMVLALLFAGCSPDDDDVNTPPGDATLVLNFQPKSNGAAMALNTPYTNVHNCTFELSELKFYVANITLHRNNGDTVRLSQVELINFRTNKHTLSYPIEAGDYTAVSFGIGVPVELNGTQNPNFLTSIYSLDHPLSATNGTYWTWQSGYRFFMAEGRYDTLPQVETTLPSLFAFHTGRDELFREVGTFSRSISGAAGTSNTLQFAVDMDTFWANGSSEVDLRVESSFHGQPSLMELGHRAADNSAAAIRLLQ